MLAAHLERTGDRTIRWGILGTGNIARSFAEGLKFVPSSKLVGIGSRTYARAAAFAGQFGIPNVYGAYGDLAAAQDIDIVYIATPNSRHKEDCLLCIDAGKAVLCEKPLATNAIDAQEMLNRARSKNVFFMEAMWMRFIPLVQKAREILCRGDIGTPCLLLANFGYPVDRDPQYRFLNPLLGGGALLDRGIYPLSLAWFMFGKPGEIAGQASVGPTGVDEQSSVLLKFADGKLAVLSSTMNAFGTNSATIIGTDGQIELSAPFYKTERISIMRFRNSSPKASSDSAGAPANNSAISRILRRLKRAGARLMNRSSDSVTIATPLEGNGYNFEAVEAVRCLRAGLLESQLMPCSESVAIIKAMDSLRAKWGIVYPCES
jgi:predicted dehydrogenase